MLPLMVGSVGLTPSALWERFTPMVSIYVGCRETGIEQPCGLIRNVRFYDQEVV